MIFQEAQVPDTIWTGMQWVLSILAIAILGFFLLKWVLKKSFPSLRSLFFFLVPTYIIGAILTISIGSDQLNQYTLFSFDDLVFFLCPPIVWDSMFAMGIDQGKLSLVLVSLFFIVFLPIWVAMKTSAGTKKDSDKKYLFIRRLVSAWVIVTIMGIGMPNFYTYIFTWLTTYSLLGMSIIFWIIIAVAVFGVIYYLRRRRKKDHDGNCQIIDGEWVCPYGEKPPQ